MIKYLFSVGALVVVTGLALGCGGSSKGAAAPEGDPLRARIKAAIEMCMKGDTAKAKSEGTALQNEGDKRIGDTLDALCSGSGGYIQTGVMTNGGPCCSAFSEGQQDALLHKMSSPASQ